MTQSQVAQYDPLWGSLMQYTVPAWFKDAKFGIFIHWGVYAVPAFANEWYPRNMYRKGAREYLHHLKTWGAHDTFGYKDFIPLFKAERWDPEAWVDLFKRAGAKYVVPVAEHHDGFPMYDSDFTNWNAARMGPCRDTVAELAVATRQAGLKFGVSSHRAFNWRYYTFSEAFDNYDPDYHKLYGVPHPEEAPVSYAFILDWYARVRELVDKFSPDVLWFDFGWHRDEFEPWRPRVVAYYYNHALVHGYEPVLQYKDKIPDGIAVLDIERGKLADARSEYWQTDTSVSYKSWCYIQEDELKSMSTIIHDLVDIVSKNGNLLLNVGPRADGVIPQGVQDVLLGVGAWLRVNGEAIYSTRPWRVYGEGPTEVSAMQFREQDEQPFTAQDIRFTSRGDTLYATCLGRPEKQVRIATLRRGADVDIASVSMLGNDQPLFWAQEADALVINTPPGPLSEHAGVFKIIMKN